MGDFGLAVSGRSPANEGDPQEGAAVGAAAGDVFTALDGLHYDGSGSGSGSGSGGSGGIAGASGSGSAGDVKEDWGHSLTGGVGTAAYRAPELETQGRRGAFTYDEKADMYSLGIILFEMVHRPFSTGLFSLVSFRLCGDVVNCCGQNYVDIQRLKRSRDEYIRYYTKIGATGLTALL